MEGEGMWWKVMEGDGRRLKLVEVVGVKMFLVETFIYLTLDYVKAIYK